MRHPLLQAAGIELPLVLLALAFFLALVFQTVQLLNESRTIAAIDRSQEAPLQETMKLRQATDALAADIADLAQSGNAHAKKVIDEMGRQNVTLRPSQAPAAPAPEPAH